MLYLVGRKASSLKLSDLFSLFLRHKSTSSLRCKENSKWTMTHRMVRAALGLHARWQSQDHYWTPGDMQRSTIASVSLWSWRNEPLWQTEVLFECSCLLFRHEPPGWHAASCFSPFNWTHFSFSLSSSPESDQSAWIKSCLAVTTGALWMMREIHAKNTNDRTRSKLLWWIISTWLLQVLSLRRHISEFCSTSVNYGLIILPSIDWIPVTNPEVSHRCSYC